MGIEQTILYRIFQVVKEWITEKVPSEHKIGSCE